MKLWKLVIFASSLLMTQKMEKFEITVIIRGYTEVLRITAATPYPNHVS